MANERVVAFDLMDTLLRDPYRDAVVAGFGRPITELVQAGLPRVWPAFESGQIDEATYWQTIRDAGHAVDPDAFHAARRAGYAWVDGMRELVDDVAATLALATNYPDWVDEVVADWLGERFAVVVASHAVGARKPDPVFYAALVSAVDRPPGAVVFVDDREVNVAAAADAGLDAVLFTGADDLRTALRARHLLG